MPRRRPLRRRRTGADPAQHLRRTGQRRRLDPHDDPQLAGTGLGLYRQPGRFGRGAHRDRGRAYLHASGRQYRRSLGRGPERQADARQVPELHARDDARDGRSARQGDRTHRRRRHPLALAARPAGRRGDGRAHGGRQHDRRGARLHRVGSVGTPLQRRDGLHRGRSACTGRRTAVHAARIHPHAARPPAGLADEPGGAGHFRDDDRRRHLFRAANPRHRLRAGGGDPRGGALFRAALHRGCRAKLGADPLYHRAGAVGRRDFRAAGLRHRGRRGGYRGGDRPLVRGDRQRPAAPPLHGRTDARVAAEAGAGGDHRRFGGAGRGHRPGTPLSHGPFAAAKKRWC